MKEFVDKTFQLYTKDKKNEKVIIDLNIRSKKEMWEAVSKYLKGINYKSYYTRIWFNEKEIVIDYGSHNYFLYLNASYEEFLGLPECR